MPNYNRQHTYEPTTHYDSEHYVLILQLLFCYSDGLYKSVKSIFNNNAIIMWITAAQISTKTKHQWLGAI